MSFENQPENDNEDSDQEHTDRDPVDRIHISDPATGWFIRIFFPDIKIFGKFAEYSHIAETKIINKCVPDLLRMDIFAALYNRVRFRPGPDGKGGLAHLVER